MKINWYPTTDCPGTGDPFHDKVAGILNGRQLSVVGSRGWLVWGAGRAVLQRFVGALVVVFGSEAIEGTLLGGHAGPRRSARSGFEGLVHALVGAVFLR